MARTRPTRKEEMGFSDTDLEALIACPKTIVDPPRKDLLQEGAHLRNDFKCQAADGDQRFRVFMRQATAFPENFSIGLVCLLDDGSELVLLRCNGPHGGVVDNPLEDAVSHHFDFHIHRASEENIANDRKAEAGAEVTAEYGTFDDALAFFVQRCGIVDAEKYFPVLGNPTLF